MGQWLFLAAVVTFFFFLLSSAIVLTDMELCIMGQRAGPGFHGTLTAPLHRLPGSSPLGAAFFCFEILIARDLTRLQLLGASFAQRPV